MRSLRFQLSLWSGILAVFAVSVFVVTVALQLRFALGRTIDQEMADFASDIFTQLAAMAGDTENEDLPDLLALFDDNNIIRVAEIRTRDGRRVFTSSKYVPLMFQREEDGGPLQTVWNRGRTWRIGRYSDRGFELDLVGDLGEVDDSLLDVLLAFALALPITLLAVVIGSRWVARRALEPLQRVTETAGAVTARELDQRVPESDAPAEIHQLIQVLNGMMDRLERSFALASRFSSDASHELRTPLTVMQGVLERALANRRGASVDELTTLLDETHRMVAIVESLLLLSRADAGDLELRVRRFDLSEMVEEMEEDLRALASEHAITIDTGIAPDVEYCGDEGLLRQAVFNLFSNAVNHNRPDGTVRVRLARQDAIVRIEVFNTGETILPAEVDRVFDRFYRGDASRSRTSGGTGLGLNLAREIVRAHGGDLELESSDERGTTFAVILSDKAETTVTKL